MRDLLAPLPDSAVARREFDRDLAATLRRAREYLEDRLDLMRDWTRMRQAQICEQWLLGQIGGEQAPPLFSVVVETVIATLLPQVTTSLAYTHGRILRGRFAVLALGKLGSSEMTVQSDLDLMFVYDLPDGVEESDGPDPLPASAYYAKLSQKLIGALSVMTEKGALFEIDMRLRPFGDAGPIASSFGAFSRYYHNDAWTWEHMALTRARAIAGDRDLSAKLADEIRTILTKQRDPGKLSADIMDMRDRVARQYPGSSVWDCKYRRGGIMDIEFVAQSRQLLHGSASVEVLSNSTKQALQRLAQAEYIDPRTADDLIQTLTHWQQIQGLLRVSLEREAQTKISDQLFDRVLLSVMGQEDGKACREDLDKMAVRAYSAYKTIVEGSTVS